MQSATTNLNMAHILIDRGVTSVCAMSYDIYDDAAGTYYKAFYEAFILGQKDFHDAASFAWHRLRRRFKKHVESDSSDRPRRESEHLIPVSYRSRTQTWKDEFNLPRIPLHMRCFLAIAATLLFIVIVTKIIAGSGYVDLLRKPAWSSWWINQFLQLLWNLFLAYIFLGVYTGSEPGMVLTRIIEYMRKIKDVAVDHFTQRDLHIQYRDFRKAQKLQGRGKNEFTFCLGQMDLEEQLYRHRGLYIYHNDPTRTRIRALVRVWIQTGFIDSATFKDANHFFDLGHRLCWNWTTRREGQRRSRGQNNPRDGRGPRDLIVIENIDQFVSKLKDEKEAENPDMRGRSVTLDGVVVNDLDDWVSCQGTEDSYLLLTGSRNRRWWLGLIWTSNIKSRWKTVQPYELRD